MTMRVMFTCLLCTVCALCSLASGAICNTTIPPTPSLGSEINAVLSGLSTSDPYPYSFCLLNGTYTGCDNITLATPAGEPVSLYGAGRNWNYTAYVSPNETSVYEASIIDCQRKSSFATTPARGVTIANLVITEAEEPGENNHADVLVFGNGSATIDSVLFFRNSAKGNTHRGVVRFGYGGFVPGAGVSYVTNTTFDSNIGASTARDSMIVAYEPVVVIDSEFVGSNTPGSSSRAALYAYDRATVVGSTFRDNTATFTSDIDMDVGGYVRNCSFSRSRSSVGSIVYVDGESGDGGSISDCVFDTVHTLGDRAVRAFDTSVTNSSFAHVTTTGFGGALRFGVSSNVRAELSNITCQDASSADSNGGCVFITGDNDVAVNVSALYCDDCRAPGGNGGGLAASTVKVNLRDSVFLNSEQGGGSGGAAVYSPTGSLNMSNCVIDTFITSDTSSGGAVYVQGGIVDNVVIRNGDAHNNVGGVVSSGLGDVTVTNTVIENVVGQCAGFYSKDGSTVKFADFVCTNYDLDGRYEPAFELYRMDSLIMERVRIANGTGKGQIINVYECDAVAFDSISISYVDDNNQENEAMNIEAFEDTTVAELVNVTTYRVAKQAAIALRGLYNASLTDCTLVDSGRGVKLHDYQPGAAVVRLSNVDVVGSGSFPYAAGLTMYGSGTLVVPASFRLFGILHDDNFLGSAFQQSGGTMVVGGPGRWVDVPHIASPGGAGVDAVHVNGVFNLTNVRFAGNTYNSLYALISVEAGGTLTIDNMATGYVYGNGAALLNLAVASVASINRLDVRSSLVVTNTGSVVVAAGAELTVTNSVFRNPRAPSGAGLLTVFGAATLSNVTTLAVDAVSAVVTSGTLVLTDSVVSGVTASGDGGGLDCVSSSTCTVSNTLFELCESSGAGGAIRCEGATACAITNSTVVDNSAESGGGISFSGVGVEVISGVVFRRNTASSGGGALDISGSGLFPITDCVFEANSATSGGAVTVSGSSGSRSVEIVNATMVDNSGATAGAALMCLSGATCSLTDVTIRRSGESAAVYALFRAVVALKDVVLADSAIEAVAAYAAANVTMDGVVVTGSGGPAVFVVGSPLYTNAVVVRENVGQYALWLSAALDVVITDSYIAANSGTGVYCAEPDTSYSTVFVNSLVCDNNPDYECESDCDLSGAPNVCSSANTTDCSEYCREVNTDFCVADGGVFAGPYDGCFACGGACDTGAYVCPAFAVCEDAAGGAFDCACPTGFAGNGTTNCTDADECALGTHNCDAHASCINTQGSFYCECDSGWEGSGVVCVDINECLTANLSVCVHGAACINTDGGHECACDDRYYGDGYVECKPCPANAHSYVGATNLTNCACDTNYYNIEGTLGADCVPCPPGKYVLFAGLLVCVDCPVDTYSTQNNTVGACIDCPEHTTTYGASGLSSVNNCSCTPGLDLVVLPGNATRCERYCPAGTYRSSPAAPCFECVAGSYSESANSPSCSLCPANRVTAGPGATSPNNCTCIDGYFAPNGGVGEDCQRWCPAGSYRPNPFALDCILCDIGQYSAEPNSAVCTNCPNNALTASQSSTSLSECVCPVDYYTPDRKVGTPCVRCPEGAKCKGGVNWPVARKGFIVVESEDGTAEFASCVPAEACAGNGKCATGYTGSLCERCKPNYYRLDGLCYPCQNNAWLIVLACFLALFVFCAVLVWFNSQDRAINKFASVVIGVNALQIAGMYGRLNLHWPPLAQKFFAILSLVNFNIELVSPECAVSVSDPFVLRWLLTMFFPLVVIAMFASIAAIGSAMMSLGACGYDAALSKWSPRYLRHTCIRAWFQLMTIGYLPLSAAVFEFFYCVKDANGVSVISTARQTQCYTPVYWSLFPVALLCFFIYPLGIPIFCGFLLKTKREKLGEFKFSLRYGFLVGRFESVYYYFELAIMARKVGVALAMSFLTDNSYVKAGGAIVVLLTSYTVQLRLTPYRETVYNLMEDGCLLSSALVLLISVVFQAQGELELTRAVLVVLVLMAMLLIIVIGLCVDAHAVYMAEREVDKVADTSEMFVTGLGDDDEFDNVAAGRAGTYNGSELGSMHVSDGRSLHAAVVGPATVNKAFVLDSPSGSGSVSDLDTDPNFALKIASQPVSGGVRGGSGDLDTNPNFALQRPSRSDDSALVSDRTVRTVSVDDDATAVASVCYDNNDDDATMVASVVSLDSGGERGSGSEVIAPSILATREAGPLMNESGGESGGGGGGGGGGVGDVIAPSILGTRDPAAGGAGVEAGGLPSVLMDKESGGGGGGVVFGMTANGVVDERVSGNVAYESGGSEGSGAPPMPSVLSE